jgi:hypothetical protein
MRQSDLEAAFVPYVPGAPETKEEWRAHGIAMDEQAILGAVESMLAAGARAELMDLFADIIKEYQLDRFVGRIGND